MGEKIARDVAKILLEIKAITLNFKKPYQYASGILSPIYCDNRLLMGYPVERKKIIQYFSDTIKENKLDFDIIAGTESAGIPHAAWLSELLKKPMIYIRKKQKDYGKENLVEGPLNPGQKIIVIEDLISTGGSSIKAITSARNSGAKVTDCLAIFTYQMKKAEQQFQEINCTLHTLSNFKTLVEVANEQKMITPEEKIKILKWNKDPDCWGKKMEFQ